MNKIIKPIWDDDGLKIMTGKEFYQPLDIFEHLEHLSIEQLIKLKKQIEEEIGKRPLIPLDIEGVENETV